MKEVINEKCLVSPEDLDVLVDGMMGSYSEFRVLTNMEGYYLPSKQRIQELTRLVENLLFPGFVESEELDELNLRYWTGQKTIAVYNIMVKEIATSLIYSMECDTSRCRFMHQNDSRSPMDIARCLTVRFIKGIPEIRRLLSADVQAAYAGDPAAKSIAEIILSYPGLHALAVHRIAHALHVLCVPVIPRMMSESVHCQTGIDIHPGATISEGLFIDHGTGVVIGETSVIGRNVKIERR